MCPSFFEENLDPKDFCKVDDFVEETALGKVLEVYERITKDSPSDKELLVIGADTVVTMDRQVYGKPKSSEEAFETLKK